MLRLRLAQELRERRMFCTYSFAHLAWTRLQHPTPEELARAEWTFILGWKEYISLRSAEPLARDYTIDQWTRLLFEVKMVLSFIHLVRKYYRHGVARNLTF